jgi:aryl-phospho-beta-D-glucosidase BglC (GH1 family)
MLIGGIPMSEKSKCFKRIISVSAAAVCMISSLRIAPLPDFTVDAAGTMTAFEITENMKIGWNLGNTLDAYGSGSGVGTETCWGNPTTTKAMIDAVKAKGCNTLRVPTTWFSHLDGDNNIDSQWMARVKEVVDYAISNDMYVILNLHHENWVDRSDLGSAYNEMKPKFTKIWSQIAEAFKDYDQHLIFESMNEPRAKDTTHEWWGPQQSEVDTINNLNADFVKLIRSSSSENNKNRLLMIPGYCASSDSTIYTRIVVPQDDLVAVSIHAYTPYDFTMNSEVQDHSVFTESYRNNLEQTLEGFRKTFIAKDIPVVIGEMGASNFNNTDARVE